MTRKFDVTKQVGSYRLCRRRNTRPRERLSVVTASFRLSVLRRLQMFS